MPSTERYGKGEGGLVSPLEAGQLINGARFGGTVDQLIVFSEGHKTPLPPGASCMWQGTTKEGEPDHD